MVKFRGMLVDLHIHTSISPCGMQHPEDVIRVAREKGLSVICLTDHFTTKVRQYIKEGLQENGLLVFIGLEYSAPEGDFVLLAPELQEFPRGLRAEEVLREVHRLGGVAIWAHPYRWGNVPDEELLASGLVDAIEVLNGRTSPRENAEARDLARSYRLPGVAGSDAHCLDELGLVANETETEIKTLADLMEAIRRGKLTPKILSDDLERTSSLIF